MARTNSERQKRTRFVGAILLTAVLSSAATSSLFMVLQARVNHADPLDEVASLARNEFATLRPGLETFATTLAKAKNLAGQKPVPDVVVACAMTPATQGQAVTIVNEEQKLLAELPPIQWELAASSTREQWQFVRVLDVRRSDSLANPGYEGDVEFQVRVSRQVATDSGQATATLPDGYEVISSDRLQELQANSDYGSEIALFPPVAEQQVYYEYPAWTPTEPPPADLPTMVQSQVHSTIFACLESQPTITTEVRQLTFRFALADQSWASRPGP